MIIHLLVILPILPFLIHSFKDEYTVSYQVQSAKRCLIIYNDDSYYLRSDPKGPLLLGSSVWGSAVVLGKYLDESCATYPWIRGKKVLDLSAGTGYVGLVAACLGADVTITDVHQMLPLLQKNIDKNAEQLKGTGGKICATALRWGDLEGVKFIPKQDVILLSGVIYTNESVEPLISTVVALSEKGTELFVSQENWSNENLTSIWEAFFNHASKYFKLSTVSFDGLHPNYDDGNLWFFRGDYNR